MSYKYAIVANNGKVVGVSRLSGPVDREDHIPIKDEESVHGKLWDGAKFVEDTTPPPAPPPEPPKIEDVLTKLAELEVMVKAVDSKLTAKRG